MRDETWECGCAGRQARLNAAVPGLGDAVKVIADPVQKGYEATMGKVLRPDAAMLLGLVLGAVVLPLIMARMRGARG